MSSAEVKTAEVSDEADTKASSQASRRGRRGKKAGQPPAQPQEGGKEVTKDGKMVDPVDMMFM